MKAYQAATTYLFDTILWPFRSFHPLVGLGVVSLLTGILMLIAFRYTSNQTEIRRVKEKVKAHILEIRLFKHDPRLVMDAQKKILGYSLIHMRYALVPFLVMVPLLVIMLAQLHLWFGYIPLQPGESAVVSVKFTQQVPWQGATVDLMVPDGVEIETPALRVDGEREVSWRVKARQPGDFNLTFRLREKDVQKRLVVTSQLVNVSPRRVRPTFPELLLFPGEAPLPGGVPIQAINVSYPHRTLKVLGWNLHWLIVFCALSLIGGYAFKGVFRVEL